MWLSLDFKTEVKKAEIHNVNKFLGIPKDYDIEVGYPTAHIEYELQPDVRDWGVRSISIVPTKIRCLIELEVDCYEMSNEEIEMFIKAGGKEYGSGVNHTVSGTIEIETNCVDGWKIENGIVFQPDGAVSINGVVIDLHGRTIALS